MSNNGISMKKILFSLFAFLVGMSAHAQDVIVKKDGSIIQSKVLEVNVADIKYKKFSNPNGPTYTLAISDVLAINYENGEKDTFGDVKPSTTTESAPKEADIHIVEPDSHNTELIARYNKIQLYEGSSKVGTKLTRSGTAILGVDENSVLSSDDVEINFVQEPWIKYSPDYYIGERFYVQIHNKLDRTIYVDLGNTFRVLSKGEAYAYYNASQTTVNHGSNSGGGFNLGAAAGVLGVGGALGTLAGGTNVGGGTSASSSTTYVKQRVLAIPPHGKVPLEKYETVHVKGNRYETISEGESLPRYFSKTERPQVMKGSVGRYDMNTSPWTAQYTITYSHSENFTDINVLKAGVYIREIVGYTLFVYGSTPEKALKSIKKSWFLYNDYTIIGKWWLE